MEYKIDLNISYVPSGSNLADNPSRSFNSLDTMLSGKSWSVAESYSGPHSIDLMSLDSNVMRLTDGKALNYFAPCHTPLSSGVNLFCQNVRGEGNLYVYPSFPMIFPVLKFLVEQGVACTVVVPKMNPLPIWWPKLEIYSVGSVCLVLKGEKSVVRIPTKKGFVVDLVGLRWPLFAFRLSFVKQFGHFYRLASN